MVAFEREFPGSSWLATRVMRELEVVGGIAEALVAGVARRHGLTHAALNALAIIEGNGEPIAAGDVAARMHITSGSTTSVLDTLERKEFIRRLVDPGDRRRVMVEVTPSAQALLDQMLPEVQQVVTAAMGGIDPAKLHELLTALAAVREAIAAVPTAFSPPLPRRRPARLQVSERHP